MAAQSDPEIGSFIQTGPIETNCLDLGEGEPVLFLHGSGPGVTAWANWRLTLPVLGDRFRCIAPDLAGFGYSKVPDGWTFNRETWLAQLIALLDQLGIEKTHVVGNSFGGAMALALAISQPHRVNRLVLMGSVGVDFPITEGLDRVWGYTPSIDAMRKVMDVFAYDRALIGEDLVEIRYRASTLPGRAEAFSAMFPAPRQRWVKALAFDEDQLKQINHETLIIHGREDRVIPPENSLRLHHLIDRSELHIFGRCGHWTQVEHASSFSALVMQFLERP